MSNEKEQKKGVLKSFTKKFEPDGVTHSVWNNQGKINYKFVLTFDNGDIGEALAVDDSGSKSWVIGEEHDYTKLVRGDQGQYISFQGVKAESKKFNKSGGGGGRTPKTKKEYLAEAGRGGLENAIAFAKDKTNTNGQPLKATEILQVAEVFADWLRMYIEKIEGLE